MQNNEKIGDTTETEEGVLQDRILRILSYTTDTTETIYLYFNNQYTADPPSYSLYEDESVLGSIYQGSVNDNSDKIKTFYNMFPKLVKSKLVDTSSTNSSYFIEDIVTRVHLPSEEFAQIIEVKTKWCRVWSWCKDKIGCNT